MKLIDYVILIAIGVLVARSIYILRCEKDHCADCKLNCKKRSRL